MSRTLIVGRLGAGKTTYSKKIAGPGEKIIHLDTIYFDSSKNYRNDKEAWRQKLDELSSGKDWIIEGMQVVDMVSVADRAEQIIFVDTSMLKSYYRFLKRAVKNRRIASKEMPDNWERSNFFVGLLWWWQNVLNFNKTYGPQLDLLLKDKSKIKIIH